MALTVGAAVLVPARAQADQPWKRADKDHAGDFEYTDFEYIDASTLQVMRLQEVQRQAAKIVQDAATSSRYAGYMNVGLEEDGVVLWWKGDLPTEMGEAVSLASKIAPVEIRPAEYSRAELDAAAAQLVGIVEANPHSYHGLTILGDGSGLRVSAAIGLRADAVMLPQVDVPVEVVAEEPMRFTDRHNDWAPWNGGAEILNASRSNGRCTSGFGVHDGYGREWLVTAAHCATPPDRITDGVGDFIGNADRENWQHDILMVRTDAHYRIYDGPPDTHFSKAVSGYTDAHPGELLCQSGDTSGVVCDLKVSNEFAVRYCLPDSDGDITCVSDLVVATQLHGLPAGAPGDSGGPVFALDGSRVTAKGIVSGGRGSTLIFQDFVTIARDFGVAPLTGY